METETKDWKPEVGKTAWIVALSDNGYVIVEGTVKSTSTGYNGYCHVDSVYFGHSHCHPKSIFPTPEAALASIKIYDLEGKEVVIPRADGIPVHFVGVCGDCSKQMVLSDEEDNAFQRVVRMAYSLPIEGGGAANGGKSDAREGGC
jgi:hypothetical protein